MKCDSFSKMYKSFVNSLNDDSRVMRGVFFDLHPRFVMLDSYSNIACGVLFE